MTGSLSRRKRERGFSMTEMLVVIGIIAVLSAVSLPSLMNYFRSARIRTAQDEVAGTIQKARNTGIMRNSQMGITFVTQTNNTYWIHAEDSVVGLAGTAADIGNTRQFLDVGAPNTRISTSYQLPPNVEFAANATECPQGAIGTYGVYARNGNALRFDRYGRLTIPGADGAQPLSGAPVITNQLYVGAAPADILICLIDRRTDLRRGLRISRAGRVTRDTSN